MGKQGKIVLADIAGRVGKGGTQIDESVGQHAVDAVTHAIKRASLLLEHTADDAREGGINGSGGAAGLADDGVAKDGEVGHMMDSFGWCIQGVLAFIG